MNLRKCDHRKENNNTSENWDHCQEIKYCWLEYIDSYFSTSFILKMAQVKGSLRRYNWKNPTERKAIEENKKIDFLKNHNYSK